MPVFKVRSSCLSVKTREVRLHTTQDHLREASMQSQEKDYYKVSYRNEIRKVDNKKLFGHMTSTSSAGES